MLRTTIQAATPELKRLIEDVLAEESRAAISERRSAARQPITRPVLIEFRDKALGKMDAFSKDISGQGIGLISNYPIQERAVARIHLNRLQGEPSVVIAECRWSKQYSTGWYLSGWNFIALESA